MKKRIILISISFVLVILSLFLLFTKINNKVNVEDFSNEKTIKKENPTTNSKDPITFKDIDNNKNNKEEEKKDTNTNTNSNKDTSTNNNTSSNKNNTNNNTNTNNNNNNNDNPTPVTPPTKPVTYSCPEGFELQGTDCYQTIAANHICANGMTSIDSGCINFSEGIETPEETCQNGYYGLSMISLGQPSKYYCYPIHEISYSCPDGYNLNGMNCTKVVPANRN